MIPGGGYVPNRHDVLTGTRPDGTAYPPGEDMTCGNWTKTDNNGKARIGHFDRLRAMPAWVGTASLRFFGGFFLAVRCRSVCLWRNCCLWANIEREYPMGFIQPAQRR
jgi:hypothetical protein